MKQKECGIINIHFFLSFLSWLYASDNAPRIVLRGLCPEVFMSEKVAAVCRFSA